MPLDLGTRLALGRPPRPPKGGPAAFVPTDLTGLALWVAADGRGTLRDDPGGGAYTGRLDAAPAPGGTWFVSQWEDMSGQGRHLSQATAVNQPQLVPGGINGLPYLALDETSGHHMQTAAFAPALAQPNTVIVVARHAWPGGGDRTLVDGIEVAGRHALFADSGNAGRLAGGAGSPWLPSAHALGGAWEALTLVADGAASELRVNDALVASGATGGDALTGITLGAAQPLDAFTTMDVVEIAVYDRALAAGERAQLQGYLQQKYGL